MSDEAEFELVEAVTFTTVGRFTTYREAVEWTRACRITAFEIWHGNELIETEDVR